MLARLSLTSTPPLPATALWNYLCKVIILYPYSPRAWHIGTFNAKYQHKAIEQLAQNGIVETQFFESISPQLTPEIVHHELELYHEREDFAPSAEPNAIYLYVPFQDRTTYTTKPLLW